MNETQDLTHFSPTGRARMVDVGGKENSERLAVARGCIRMQAATLERIQSGRIAKGDVLAVADVAADQPTAEPVPTPVFDVPEFSAEADPVFAEALDMPDVASVDALPVDEMSLDFDLGDAAAVATAVEAVDVVESTPEAVAEEPYVDTVVTAEATPDALDFDLSGMVGGDIGHHPDRADVEQNREDLRAESHRRRAKAG